MFFGLWRPRKSISELLNPTKVIKVHRIRFVIRRLNTMDFMAGSKGVRELYGTFQAQGLHNVEITQESRSRLEAMLIDSFMAGVVEPKLKRVESDPGEGLPVRHLLTDWQFAVQLYQGIMEFTYGKKKVARALSKIEF